MAYKNRLLLGALCVCVALGGGVSYVALGTAQAASIKADQSSAKFAEAETLFKKGFALFQQGYWQDSLPIFDEVIHQFGHISTPSMSELIAQTYISKGGALFKLGRTKEALLAFNEIVRRFQEEEC